MDKIEKIEKLEEIVSPEQIFYNEPMKKRTTMKVGGPADIFIEVSNLEELMKILELEEIKNGKCPITILGNGSNTLVRDNGIRGLVIKYIGKNITIDKKSDDEIYVTAEAGALNKTIGTMMLKNSITGFEFADAIPGSIGGAVVMNAGAYGHEMKDIIVETKYVDLNTLELKTINNEQHEYKYRNSIFENGTVKALILQTKMKMKKRNPTEIKAQMDEYISKRKEKQPLEYPSLGSTFKRGEGFITSQVIDEAGLKGYQIGGAMVSKKHAGFVINYENATCKDILAVIDHVKKTVFEKYGYEIKPEVRIIGDEGLN